MPSKKQRSKQRRAVAAGRKPEGINANDKAAARCHDDKDDTSWPTLTPTDGPNVIVNGTELTPSQVVAAISRGERDVTYAAMYMQMNNNDAEVMYRQQLYEKGIVKILLGFLDQCDGPLSSIELRAESHDEVMITTPFHWVHILNL
jgi:hypothetical protein